MRSTLLVLIAMLLATFAVAQDYTIRVMTYNLLNYSTTSNDRNDEFATIINEIDPDIILAQEVINNDAADDFLDEVLDGTWSRTPGPLLGTSDEYAFYRNDLFELVSHASVPTDLRNHEIYQFAALNIPTEPEIWFGNTHLKASQGEEDRRYDEVLDLLSYMTSEDLYSTDFFFCGDFNIYTSSEPAYQALMNAGFEDPIETPGNWHDNASLAAVHTQSPRTSSFGGGATGGMDDRFDFILAQESLFDSEGWDVLATTYTAFGNDGNHFNQAINNGTNSVVSPEVADALHAASDHIPVFVDVGYWLSGEDIIFTLEPAVPNQTIFPGGGTVEFTAYITNTTNQMIVTAGWTEAILPNGNTYGPLAYVQPLPIPANYTIVRPLTQNIPASAPGGEYSLVGKIGNNPNNVFASDSFTFTKLGGGNVAAFLHDIGLSDATVSANDATIPAEFELTGLYPNPFNGSSTIELSLPQTQRVAVTVHDVTGRQVASVLDGTLNAGSHRLNLNLSAQASGIYFVTAQSQGEVATLKAMLVR